MKSTEPRCGKHICYVLTEFPVRISYMQLNDLTKGFSWLPSISSGKLQGQYHFTGNDQFFSNTFQGRANNLIIYHSIMYNLCSCQSVVTYAKIKKVILLLPSVTLHLTPNVMVWDVIFCACFFCSWSSCLCSSESITNSPFQIAF